MTTTNLVRGDKPTIPESVKVHFSNRLNSMKSILDLQL